MPAYSSVAAALDHSTIRRVLDQLTDLSAIRAIVRQALSSSCPGLDPDSIQLDSGEPDLTRGTLVLAVRTAAEASKLRQTLPLLMRTLQQKGFHLSEIRLRVQPSTGLPESETDAQPDRDATRSIAERRAALAFAEHLAKAGPDTALGLAAERLARSLREQSP